MKKPIACVVLLSILISLFSPAANAVISSGAYGGWPGEVEMNESTPFTYEFLPATVWTNLDGWEQPATFSENKITYTLADNVVVLGKEVTDQIASAGQLISGGTQQKLLPNKIVAEGGYISAGVLDTAAKNKGYEIKNGSVVVDETTGTAFKVVSPTVFRGMYNANEELQNIIKPLEGTYAVTKPALHEVIKDFTMQEETIHLTRGNISGFAPNVEKNVVLPGTLNAMSFEDSLIGFKKLSSDPLIKFEFTKERLDAYLGNGSPVKVTVSGGLGIDNIDLTGSYSGFGGYRIELTLKQESYLSVLLDADVSDEVRIPILGIDVPFGIGRITGGVFAIVGIDGTIKLEIHTRTYTATTLGVRGSTKFYIPTSAHPIFNQTFESDGDVDLAGDIDGYLKFGPMLGIELFGFDLVGAGLFLGAGVRVQAEGKMLNVELYGIFNVYVDFAGDHFNLANYYPTILTKRVADTGGYLIEFVEAFVKPGRAGGTIQAESNSEDDTDGYVPAPNIPYRVLVVPKGESFDPNNPSDIEKASVRKYPSTGYALTNSEGEFIQKDDNMLYDGDWAYLEFQVNGHTYISNPVNPTLPFEKVAVTAADYFNDYVTGQVQPVRVINWEAAPDDPPEEQYEWTYYNNGLIYVNPYKSFNYNTHVPFGGQAKTMTDQYGNFDTRNLLVSIVTGKPIANAYFDVYENPETWGAMGGFDLTLDDHEALIHSRVQFKSTMSLSFTRVLDEVENSYDSYEEDGKIINRMAYDEYIWIINPNGTRAVTEDEFCYLMDDFSTQDFHFNGTDYRTVPAYVRNVHWELASPGEKKLISLLDKDGNPTGTTLFSQRVTVEWVWQAHPNPVKITSADHTELSADGGSFQVTATGFVPFAFSLSDAPDGVTISKTTGLITIPAGMQEKSYTFTIRAAEERTFSLNTGLPGASDPYKGNDPSLPDEQLFTLTIKGGNATPQPSQTPGPASSVSPEPPETPGPTTSVTPQPSRTPEPTASATPTATGTAPVISSARHGYQFTQEAGSGDLRVAINATGSTPITWSLAPRGDRRVPEEVSISSSGVLWIEDGLEAGTYYLTIKAENAFGTDTQDCQLTVTEPRYAPELYEETHGYAFTKLVGADDLTVQIRASGSAPITYSLEQTSRYIIPDEVSINSDTGLLTIKEGLEPGTYRFTICVSNDVGEDTQECSLEVVALTLPSTRPILRTGWSSQGTGSITLLSASSGTGTKELSDFSALSPTQDPPANSVTIRYDDPDDVYTNDRYSVNGAAFIHWQSCPGVRVGNAGVGTMLLDESPRCDNYHYWDAKVAIPGDVEDKIKQSFKTQLSAYQSKDVFLGERMSGEDLLGQMNDFSINQMVGGVTYLEYGSMLESMKAQQGGSFQVDLNEDTGTMVTGKYFVGLQNNNGAELTFQQDGASVTFMSKDVKTSEDSLYDLYDFGFSQSAFHEKEMLSAAGSGGEDFLFSFAYHGELPGMAAFSVTTDMAEGTKVNVYRFEEEIGGYTLIAKDLNTGSGGVVTYKNNTMSEYLITTKTIGGAQNSDMVFRQNSALKWLLVIGMIAALLILGFIGWVVIRKSKRGKNQKE